MSTRLSWSREDQNIVLSAVKQYPNNLRAAFEKAAVSMPERTIGAISAYYYSKLRHEGTVMTVVSSSGISTLGNQKNARRDLKQELSVEQQLDIILAMIKKLNRNEKKKVVEVMLGL